MLTVEFWLHLLFWLWRCFLASVHDPCSWWNHCTHGEDLMMVYLPADVSLPSVNCQIFKEAISAEGCCRVQAAGVPLWCCDKQWSVVLGHYRCQQ